MGKVYHVSQHENGWQVKAEGNEKATKTFKTQKEAIDFANAAAKSDPTTRVMVHKKTGGFRKQ